MRQLRREFVAYVRQLGKAMNWLILGLVCGLLGLSQELVASGVLPSVFPGPVVLPAYAWFLIGIASVAWGGFSAFRKERGQHQNTRDELEALRRKIEPNLGGEITGVHLLTGKPQTEVDRNKDSGALAFRVRINNSGGKTSIRDDRWRLYLGFPDEQERRFETLHPPKGIVTGQEHRKPIDREGMIYVQCLEPFERTTKSGLLVSESLPRTVGELERLRELRVRVVCEDIDGNDISFSNVVDVWASTQGPPPYMPGIEK